MAWHAKETLRGLYDQPAEGAPGYLDELVESLLEPAMSPELRQLGRTLRTWRHEICAWHQAHVSNGPTEATNSLIKVIKRIGFGSAVSATTGSESCSTPADPTGTYSPRSTRSPHRNPKSPFGDLPNRTACPPAPRCTGGPRRSGQSGRWLHPFPDSLGALTFGALLLLRPTLLQH
jgi:hypothetical protein